jgi:hypothetical protein
MTVTAFDPATYVPTFGDVVTVRDTGYSPQREATATVSAIIPPSEGATDTFVMLSDFPTGPNEWPYPYRQGSSRDARAAYAPDVFANNDALVWWFNANQIVNVVRANDATDPSEADALRAELANVRRLLSQSLTTIGESLAATANRREWCDEYESHLDRLLSALPYQEGIRETLNAAASRQREYEVCIHYTVSGTTTVTVSASDEDSAAELVSSDPWNYVDSYAL